MATPQWVVLFDMAKLSSNNYHNDSFIDPEQKAVYKIEPGVLALSFPQAWDDKIVIYIVCLYFYKNKSIFAK